MIKSLKDARIVDGLPRILAKQPWVRALSEAMGVVHEMTMTFASDSQIYTDIDHAAENVLDALAVNWKIDWYETGYSVEQKRRIVKAALAVRRTMGTAAAVKAQADAIYPGTTLEEWFEWGGEPGTFRLHVDISQTDAQHPIIFSTNEEIEKRLATAKRFSAQLESMSYQVRHGIEVDASVTIWTASPPLCGMITCGVYPNIKTLGWSGQNGIAVARLPEVFAVSPELCGTLPQDSTLGQSVCVPLLQGGENVAGAYVGMPAESGVARCGTLQ